MEGPLSRGGRVLHLCRDFQEVCTQLLEELGCVSDMAGENNKAEGSKDNFYVHLVGDVVVISPGDEGLS